MIDERTLASDIEVRTWYTIAGLTVASSIPLDDLAPRALATRADVEIRSVDASVVDAFAARAVHAGSAGDGWVHVLRADDGFLLRWPEQLDAIIDDEGRTVLVHQRGTVRDSVARLLVHPVFSFVLPAHGREGLHGSAVEIDGVAVVFAGRPGAGKSTLATAACAAGARLIADDLVSIRRTEDGSLVVDPTARKTWLLHGVAQRMAPPVTEDLSRAKKLAVSGYAVASEPVPLGAVYLVSRDTDASEIVVSEPLPPAKAMVAVLTSLFNRAVRSDDRLRVQFDVASQLAGAVPVRRFTWSPDPRTASAYVQHLLSRDDDVARDSRSVERRTMESDIAVIETEDARTTQVANDRRRLLELLAATGVETDVEGGFEEILLRTSQVAAVLRTSDRTIRTWSDAGKIRSIRTLGGRRLFPASAVIDALRTMQGGSRADV